MPALISRPALPRPTSGPIRCASGGVAALRTRNGVSAQSTIATAAG